MRHTLLGRARLPVTPPARVLGGSRTRNRRLLKPPSLPELEYEHVSRRPVPTRAVRLTKAEPQPCAAAKLGNQDSNLDSSGPEPDVLPDYTIPH